MSVCLSSLCVRNTQITNTVTRRATEEKKDRWVGEELMKAEMLHLKENIKGNDGDITMVMFISSECR